MLDNLSINMQWAIYWIVAIAGVGLSALYSGMEMGFYVLNKVRLELSVEQRRRGARTIHHQLAHPRRLLATLLIGNNVANYAFTYAVSAMFILGGAGRRAEFYAIVVGTGILFVLGETLPKNVFQRLAETLMYRLAWLVRLSGWLFTVTLARPLVLGFAWLLTRFWRTGGDEQALGHVGVAAIVAEGQASGALTDFQTRMAQRVMGISQVMLKKAMIPMQHVVAAPVDITREGIFEIMKAHEYRRLPLRDSDGRIAGVLDIYHALSSPPQTDLQSLAPPPLVLDESLNITQALYRMQRQRIALAVVADAQARHVGIVAIKDLVEEIVGEIENW
ncbi:MAG: CNNM domain-containing protein [Planctomycetaceae bacterium]|nr:CNNM domain-containing protein [Planctomycetaceae bacterium]